MNTSALNRAQSVVVHGTASVNAITGDQIQNHFGPGVLRVAGDHITYNTGTPKGIDLLHQHTSPAALLDSDARLDQPRCMPGTRETVIQEIMDWVKGGTNSSASILWLQGPVGTGKTALAHTIAELCRLHGLFIATFFFSRTASNSSDGNLLIPTLASQLVEALPETRRYIDKAIRKDPRLFERARETQMKKLIVRPLKHCPIFRRLQNMFGLKPYPRLIAIDGLDECSDKSVQCNILKIIGDAVQDLKFPVRFLIASRPESHIVQAIEAIHSNLPVPRVDLKDDTLARLDMKLYFVTNFADIRRLHPELPEGWPGDAIIWQLVDYASGQFIYASTVIAYIKSPYHRPEDRLRVILLLSMPPTNEKPFARIDCLYLFIIRSAEHREVILQILGLLIVSRATRIEGSEEPLGPTDIEHLLGLQPGDVRRSLTDMHSLIDLREDTGHIKILHASLSDFLIDPSRSMELFIDTKTSYWQTMLSAMKLLRLKFNDLIPTRENSKVVSVDTFINQALGQCTMDDLSGESRVAICLRILEKWEIFTRSAPWLRTPATDILQKICKAVMDINELNLDAHLQSFWSAYEWSPVNYLPRVGPSVGRFDLQGPSLDITKFVGMLSNGGILLQPVLEDTSPHKAAVAFKCHTLKGPDTRFYFIADESEEILRVCYDLGMFRTVDMDKLHSTSRQDQASEAWRVIANAYLSG